MKPGAVTDGFNVMDVDNHHEVYYWTLIQVILTKHALSHFIKEAQTLANSGCSAVLYLFGVHYLAYLDSIPWGFY